MNKLEIPNFDDIEALKFLASNNLLSSYPNLAADEKKISKGYAQYISVKGNAFLIKKLKLKTGNSDFLIKHYKSPPAAIDYLNSLRSDKSHRTCPMCGSFHRNSLDHILPKEKYGEFSIFTKNLVPACKCNSLRKENLVGPNPGERILHPYFDDCLKKRLLRAKFTDLGQVPSISIEIRVSTSDVNFPAIDFHLREVVLKTALLGYIAERWSDFVRKPSLIVRELKNNPRNLAELKSILISELKQLDEVHRSKNNWNSIFLSGLIETPTMKWIYEAMSAKKRKPNGALR